MMLFHTGTSSNYKTPGLNAQYNELWEEFHFIKETHLQSNTNNHKCERFGVN